MSRAEYFARECRKFLELAHVLEVAGNIKDADGIGAKAANKLQQAYTIGCEADKVKPILPSLIVPCPACDGGYRDVGNTTIRCGQCRGTGQRATNGGEA